MISKSCRPFNDSLHNRHLNNVVLSAWQRHNSPLFTDWTVARTETERYCCSSRSPPFTLLPTPHHSYARGGSEDVFPLSLGTTAAGRGKPQPQRPTHSPRDSATGTPNLQAPRPDNGTTPRPTPRPVTHRRAALRVAPRPRFSAGLEPAEGPLPSRPPLPDGPPPAQRPP